MIETKFKQTELGLIPEDWDVSTLRDCSQKITDGSHFSPPEFESSPFYMPSVKDMGETDFILSDCKRISKDSFLDLKKMGCCPQIGDVVIAKDGSILKSCFPITNNRPLVVLSSIAIITPLKNCIDGLFLSKYFKFPPIKSYVIENYRGGTGVPRIILKNFAKLPLYYPSSIKEQKKIAEALNDVDALIRELDDLTEKKKAVLQGTMQELLTGRRRLSGFHEPWREVAFKDLGYIYNGLSGKTGADFGHGESKFIMFVNVIYRDTISPNYFGSVDISLAEKQNKVQQNDLIFNTSSETPEEVGMCCCVSEEYPNLYLNSFCFGFRFYESNVNARFITFILRSRVGRLLMMELAQGSTRYNLSKRRFLSSSIKLPKDIREQNDIAMILSDMTKEIEELEAKREKYAAIRLGMMQQLLTGKIRLI